VSNHKNYGGPEAEIDMDAFGTADVRHNINRIERGIITTSIEDDCIELDT